jgi:hypothetical protein
VIRVKKFKSGLPATEHGTNKGTQAMMITRKMRVLSVPNSVKEGGQMITLWAPGRFHYRVMVPYSGSGGTGETAWFRAKIRVYRGGSVQLKGFRWFGLRRKLRIIW